MLQKLRHEAGTMITGAELSARLSRNAWIGYVVAALATGIVLLVCRILNPFLADYVAYILLFPAVAFAAWYFGVGPSILSVALASVGAKYWFIAPVGSLRIFNAKQVVGIGTFLLASGLVVVLGEARRRENERLRNAQGSLEERVRGRTAELNEANRSLRELSARLLELQDDERRRIARELHDSVGQMLVGLTMNLSNVRSDVERLAKTMSALADSEALVQEMSQEVRTISYLLHPPLLDDAGLASAIRWYVDGYSKRSGINVDLELQDDLGRFPREIETAVFRTVQECLTNIHRHSGSPVASVRLARSDGYVRVEVRDKGKGIPAEKQAQMHLNGTPGVGIRGMRERIRQLGGNLEISCDGHGKGTAVEARLPIPGVSSTAAA